MSRPPGSLAGPGNWTGVGRAILRSVRRGPAWETIPSWALLGTRDHVIPPALQEEMYERADARITRVKGWASRADHPAGGRRARHPVGGRSDRVGPEGSANDEDRRDRRGGAHRIQARRKAGRGRPRRAPGIAGLGRRHTHRRGSGRSARERPGRGRRVERGRCGTTQQCFEFFQTSTRNVLLEEMRGLVSAITWRCRSSAPIGSRRVDTSARSSPRRSAIKAGSTPVLDCSRDAVLRVLGPASPIRAATAKRCACPPVLIQPEGSRRRRRRTGGRGGRRAGVNGTIELAGPERFRFDELVQRVLDANGDARRVSADEGARYFGAALAEGSLIPGDDVHVGLRPASRTGSPTRPLT